MTFQAFQTLIFDLDDTLIPTSEVLIPPALERTYQVLQKYRHPWTFNQYNEFRKSHIENHSHRQIFKILCDQAEFIPEKQRGQLLKELESEFYTLQSLPALSLIEGAEENLARLSKKYKLILLTAGDEKAQKLKIQKAQIFDHFHLIQVADAAASWSKKAILENWAKNGVLNPATTLSIGNRLKEEIEATKAVGGWTCYFRFGEHKGERPRNDLQVPDFEIDHHKDLIPACRL